MNIKESGFWVRKSTQFTTSHHHHLLLRLLTTHRHVAGNLLVASHAPLTDGHPCLGEDRLLLRQLLLGPTNHKGSGAVEQSTWRMFPFSYTWLITMHGYYVSPLSRISLVTKWFVSSLSRVILQVVGGFLGHP